MKLEKIEPEKLHTELVCAWREIARQTSNPEGKLKDCYKCKGFKKGCYDYAPQPKRE